MMMRVVLAIACSCGVPLALRGDDVSEGARKYFSDTELVNQNGEKLRFYTDLMKGKTVVINSFFATCTTVCPPMTQKLVQVQNALGDRFGKDVFFLSLTVDPANDTPPKLKEFAEKYHAKPGWYFLTGKKENVDWVLSRIGQYVEDKEDHSTILVVGNEPKRYWKKLFSLAKTEELIKLVMDVMDAK